MTPPLEYRVAELERKLASMLLWGTVAEVDLADPRVKVRYGEGAVSGWVPWMAVAAGNPAAFNAPVVGEQCALLSPSGVIGSGWAQRGFYCTAFPAPDSAAGIDTRAYADGATISYDPAAHELAAVLPDGGKASVAAPGGLAVAGDVTIAGALEISGDLAVQGAAMRHAGADVGRSHVHGGVQSGPAVTGPPQ